jgi:CRISPR/Cas system Type II protein with McrA/HNH and RuvC-like nuclease domain
MKQKINIGIDIGPTSVAIAATNEECKIIGKPTIFRFKDACDEKTGGVNNASRRDYRHFHRRLSRKKTLFSDFRKMLKTFNIQLPVDFFKHISSCTKTPP